MSTSEEAQMILPLLHEQILGLDHIGYVVEDLAQALDDICRLYGIAPESVEVMPPWDTAAETARFAFVTINPGLRMELIEPISVAMRQQLLPAPCAGGKASLGVNDLNGATLSGPGGINHLAYRVADIAACCELLAGQGIAPGHVTPKGVVNTGSSKIVYFNPRHTGGHLLELVERTSISEGESL